MIFIPSTLQLFLLLVEKKLTTPVVITIHTHSKDQSLCNETRKYFPAQCHTGCDNNSV